MSRLCLYFVASCCLVGIISGQSNFVSSRSSFGPISSSFRQTNFIQNRPSNFQPSRSSSFAPSRSSSFSNPSSRGVNSENLCQLRLFAEDRCSRKGPSCRTCIVDTVERSCPYDAQRGPPDCTQLQSCAKRLAFNC